MVIFALSCFGLLLFLWLSFGGPIPLKPKGYRVQVAVPGGDDARPRGRRARRRRVGRQGAQGHRARDGGNRTMATIELDPSSRRSPSDARAILRQKTLLGETYIELTPGSPSAPRLPEGGAAGRRAGRADRSSSTRSSPRWTRRRARRSAPGRRSWPRASRGRGPRPQRRVRHAAALRGRRRRPAVRCSTRRRARSRGWSRTPASVFGALTEKEAQLRNLITSSDETFDATGVAERSLAETIRIFPTFLDESRLTLARLKTFARDTGPLVRDLRPVTRDLRPTLADLKALAPDLEKFFRDLEGTEPPSEDYKSATTSRRPVPSRLWVAAGGHAIRSSSWPTCSQKAICVTRAPSTSTPPPHGTATNSSKR